MAKRLSKKQKQDLMPKSGYVYGIACGRKIMKIGSTFNVPWRMKALSHANPFTLTLKQCLRVPSIEMREIEKWLHNLLAKRRVHREWFWGEWHEFAHAFEEASHYFEDVHHEREMRGMYVPYRRPGKQWQTTLKRVKDPTLEVEEEQAWEFDLEYAIVGVPFHEC